MCLLVSHGFFEFGFIICELIDTLVASYAGRKVLRSCLRLKTFFF